MSSVEETVSGVVAGAKAAQEQARCRSCHAPILWAITVAGRAMPLDLEPLNLQTYSGATGGLFAVLERVAAASRPSPLAVTVGKLGVEGGELARLGLAVRQSHFATCPNADQHRRR